jgi:cytochrome c-type biogenesis protein CcmH/NrfF
VKRNKPSQPKGRRFLAVALTAVWTIGGGFNVAHADGSHHMNASHLNNPVAWMVGPHSAMHGGMAAMHGEAMSPAMPFDCDMEGMGEGQPEITVAGMGASVPGGFGAGAGLAVLAQQAQSSKAPKASPSLSPIDMTLDQVDELGPFPDVPDDQIKEVTNNILCQCGCNLTVAACELAMTCDVSKKMKYDAAVMLDQGMTPQQALDQFAQDYGEKVLAAPTKEGINLVSWILPFVGLAAGILLVGWALTGWRKQRPETADVPSPDLDPDVQARIDDEVNRGL